MNKQQAIAAMIIALSSLIAGVIFLEPASLFLRLLLGLGLGFALAKGAVGFAGSVNRAYRHGSTQLLQTLMFMFVVTSILSAGLLFNADPGVYELWVNPINMGLLLGGVMFGAGMTLSSCCASGVMVEMVSDVPRALITLFFFGAGVFFGFPIQASQSWITKTWFSTESFPEQGVYLPDLFSSGPLEGYFYAILMTMAFALIVIVLAKKYEDYRRSKGSYLGVDAERDREALSRRETNVPFRLFSAKSYENTLSALWSMRTTALVIAVIFTIMMATTGQGWGASTPFGIWFAKFLMMVGLSAETLADFSQRPEGVLMAPFFVNQVSVQNVAIMLGALIAMLFMGRFAFSFTLRHAPRQYVLFALGGLLMGFGTRLANGCNVGALFTPIVNFSLSGWIYLVVLLIGGVLGNRLYQKVMG